MSGVACARRLHEHGFAVTIFEKSRGAGGRMSTRRVGDLRFDHGAQYFTARDPQFIEMVQLWKQEGHVDLWKGKIAVIGRAEKIELAEPGTERFVATPNMNSLCKHLAVGLKMVTQTRVGSIERDDDATWRLRSTDEEALGSFDGVVVTAPAEQTAELLVPLPSLARQAASCKMNPCWSAMIALADGESLSAGFDGAFVHNSPITWIARNCSKPQRNGAETWVVHASNEWTWERMELSKDNAAMELLKAFRTVVDATNLQPAYLTAHFWRYAIPPQPLEMKCLFDEGHAVIACGDWCGGPRVEGAYLSGVAAAGKILERWSE